MLLTAVQIQYFLFPFKPGRKKNGGPAVGGDNRHRLSIRIGRGGADSKKGLVFKCH